MQVKVEEKSSDIGRCGCGRSPSGYCVGWHALSESEYAKKLAEFKVQQALLESKGE